MPGAGPLGLYIHVPFCAAICSYCNFNRGLLDDSLKRRYVAALTREIERRGDGSHVDSIFFGGGTPSLLSAEEVSRVLGACRAAFDVARDAETTLEMNPESCSRIHVSALLDAGINRISLGAQVFRRRGAGPPGPGAYGGAGPLGGRPRFARPAAAI